MTQPITTGQGTAVNSPSTSALMGHAAEDELAVGVLT